MEVVVAAGQLEGLFLLWAQEELCAGVALDEGGLAWVFDVLMHLEVYALMAVDERDCSYLLLGLLLEVDGHQLVSLDHEMVKH